MEKITLGVPTTLVAGTVYALPSKRVFIHSSADVQVSNDSTTGFVTLASSTTGVETAALFVQTVSTTAAATLVAKGF